MADTNHQCLLESLTSRLEKYLTVQRGAEQEGNASKTRRYKRIVSQYEMTIKLVKAGKPIALDELPNPPGFPPLIQDPSVSSVTVDNITDSEGAELMETSAPPFKDESLPAVSESVSTLVVPQVCESDELSVADKLLVRMEKYQAVLRSAEEEGVAAKVRRYKRIIHQYEVALMDVKSGRLIELADLPNPPGLPPLVPQASPLPSPLPARATAASTQSDTDLHPVRDPPPIPSKRVVSRAEKQTSLLKERQQEYKEAALAAKRNGQLPEAKEYLRMYKGFDRLIQASSCGMPVDLTSIPPPLKSSKEPEDLTYNDTVNTVLGSDTDTFEMIKQELTEQIKSCMSRRNHFKATGDITNSNRFENWALTFKKALNKLNLLQNSGQPAPKFHFEQHSFSVIQCFTDIGPGEVELSIVQAVNLPKTADTYVGYEFPFPPDSSPSGYTSVVKDSSDPAYNAVVKFQIDRESKQCQRIFKRQGIKLEIWAKGGFFHRDTSLGTVVIKLAPLNTNLMIHDAFELMNGRRPAGGKIEVKIKIREPMMGKKIETITEKWIIVD